MDSSGKYADADVHEPGKNIMIKTSETHPLRIDSLKIPGIEGILGLTFCPGKKQLNAMTGIWDRSLDADLKVIKDWGASTVISLLEWHELEELSVKELPEVVKRYGLSWLIFQITDMQVPGDDFEIFWERKKHEIYNILKNAAKIVLHCKGGLGRTGTLAARILIEHGVNPAEAIRLVRNERIGAIENMAQEEYILQEKWTKRPRKI